MAESLTTAQLEDTWWTRPAGGREVLQVAAPLIVSTLSWTVMTYADRIMLSWYSGTAMTAAFSANIMWFAILCFPLGVCSYANTFVAQYHGSHQPERIGLVIWQAIWIALGFTPPVLMTILFAPQIFGWGGHTAESFQYEVDYFRIITYASPAMMIAQSAAAFFSGRGKTWIVMIVDTTADLFNVGLDYVMIFGYAGFPEMGIKGAAWGTTIGLWLRVAIYMALLLTPHNQRVYHTLRDLRFDGELMRRILRFGGPSGFQMLLDVTGFTIFVMLIGRLGAVPAEASSRAFSVSMLAFMPVYGLGMAVMVLVGQKLGENRDDLAARSTYTALWMAYGYMLCISAMYLLVPDLFLFGFHANAAELSEKDLAVQEMATKLLRFVAAYNLFDATFMVFSNAIKGAGDTKFILRVSMLLAALLGTLSYVSVEIWRLSVFGCWLLIVAWILIAALTFFLRFRQGKWRAMRVIEVESSMDLQPTTAVAE